MEPKVVFGNSTFSTVETIMIEDPKFVSFEDCSVMEVGDKKS